MRLPEPQIDRHLLPHEVVEQRIRHHWPGWGMAVGQLALGVAIPFLPVFTSVPPNWILLLLGVALIVHGGLRILISLMDVLVVTNMRVFRVHGLFSRGFAEMPLTRIVDISMTKPLMGRVLGYGHFAFENAAQRQGLSEIKYVKDPDSFNRYLSDLLHRAGVFSMARPMADAAPAAYLPEQSKVAVIDPEPTITIRVNDGS